MRALLAVVLALALPATAGAATITVQPGGSVNAAASSAQAGDTIILSPGAYGSQSISGTRPLTVKAQGAVMPGLSISASNLTWEGGRVDAAGQIRQAMYFSRAHDVTVRDLSVGNNRESILVMMDGGYPTTGSVTDIVFDRVTFHDSYIAHGSAKHVECVFLGGTQRVTFRNSLFRDCTTFDVFVTSAGGDNPAGLTVENTVMGAPWADGDPNIGETPRSIGQPGLAWRSSSGIIRDVTLRNSTFQSEVRWSSLTPSGTNRVVGNVLMGGAGCKSGVAFSHNVTSGSACSSSDRRVSTFGLNADLRPVFGSPVIGAGDPADHPATDRDGVARDSAPDAGAYEYQAVPDPTPDPDPAPDPTPDPDPDPAPDPCTQTAADRDQALADLAAMTANRDAWKARAQKAEDQLDRIRAIVGE